MDVQVEKRRVRPALLLQQSERLLADLQRFENIRAFSGFARLHIPQASRSARYQGLDQQRCDVTIFAGG